MSDVPFHNEVREFSVKLAELSGGQYAMACEHQHSCCTLIAHKSLQRPDGKWMTWIDYAKFQQLVTEYYRSGKAFTYLDYAAETPAWAVYGSAHMGFSPADRRV